MNDNLKQQALEFLDDFEGRCSETKNIYGVRAMIETLLAELDQQTAEIGNLEAENKQLQNRNRELYEHIRDERTREDII